MSASGTELPEEIAIAGERDEMRIAWSDGRTGHISASALRLACRCGWCTRDRALGRPAPEVAHVLLADVAVLGSHGLHVRFSDGHERGIFPWPYLVELSGTATRGARAPGADDPAQALATTGAAA